MKNKTKLFLVAGSVLFSTFILRVDVQAGSCGEIAGQECKIDKCDSYGMDVAMPTSAFICDGKLFCCVPKGMVISDPCTNLVSDSACVVREKLGVCENGICKIDEEINARMAKNKSKFGLVYSGPKTLFLGIFKLIGILSLVAFVIFAIQYYFLLTEEQKLEIARKRMRKATTGIILALVGLIITYAIIGMFGA